ncbi:MAG: RagB/SusD family nutrient uptake outer membrane protein [Saprospiraceae bacterium]|nr:RagB/SusD family nutrient uptake outer membrane protein [Saprospiraceae bacterium]MCF8251683.1 RagB/SusD family nutrient uptake outer membrane protein [Saprospiraceae bacterium]MCF8282028.1 RagB/SusD family nutrient uptake outer membrane protein [Bacteroidales bacterium]MCF8311252.1 RagB/SusD family nutrient uptake outer membrane protein [Saprospiraceae bacterium]MCF8442046.1 RagB/SusD family nutrient uptake outer membrane protein [Saprospiraceae bacterium]
MKNIIAILSFLLFLTMFSCMDFLDLEPHSQSIAVQNSDADSVYFKSASEVEAALAGAYSDFKNEYWQLDYFVNGDAQSDDAYAGGDNPDNFQIDDYHLDATNRNVSRDWAYLYSTIGKCNTVINNVGAVTDPDLTAARKEEIIGEASFIRAFMYFQLVQQWGDVPLQLTEVKTISADKLDEIYAIIFPARSPQAEVYAQIIKDLETALTRVRPTAPHKGFVTTGAVNAVLAKVYATLAPQDWAKVGQYCDAVIAGGYTLLPSYDALWDNANENSAESIFEINYDGGTADGNWGTKIFRGLDWKKFNLPSNDLIAAFDAEGDMIRKNASIAFEDVSGKWSDEHYPQTQYPFINKWHNFQEGSDQNYIFIRLADILLLKAEAMNELGDQPGAAAIVNQIRDRVNLAPTPATSQADLRLAIEKERRLELAFEAHRWFDLKRTGRAAEVMSQTIDHTGQPIGYVITPQRLVWPIPQAELDKNSKLVQNDGY